MADKLPAQATLTNGRHERRPSLGSEFEDGAIHGLRIPHSDRLPDDGHFDACPVCSTATALEPGGLVPSMRNHALGVPSTRGIVVMPPQSWTSVLCFPRGRAQPRRST